MCQNKSIIIILTYAIGTAYNYEVVLHIHSQYGIYTTRIRNDLSCDIRRRNYQIKDVDTIGGDPRIKLIYSPGIELSTQEE